MRPAATVVARWSTRHATTTTVGCEECGETIEVGTTACPECRQQVLVPPIGMLAVLVETTGGDRRLVVAERTPGGGWAPTRQMAATPLAVRAIVRQDHARGGGA